jgi:hypothetical protein
MTERDDDTVGIREDSFLGRLVPQVADHLAGQHVGDFDAEAGQARFRTWLTEHAERHAGPGGHAKEPAVIGAEVIDGGIAVGQAGHEDFPGRVMPLHLSDPARDLAAAEEPRTGQAPWGLLPTARAPGEIKIGLWGSPACGKTTYLAALRHAVDIDPADGRWVVHPGDDASADFMAEHSHNLVINHQFPGPTFPGAETPLRWHFVGDIAGSRFDQRKLRRRAPVPSEFVVELADVSGEAYGDSASEHHMPDVIYGALDHLITAQGLIYLFDPIRERDARDSAEYLNRTIIALSRHMLAEGRLVNGYLPHHIAVCVTKFDHPAVFQQARRHGLVTPGPDGSPQILGKDARTLFDMICDDSFWGEAHEHSASSGRFVRDELKARFHPDRIRYFATSAVGFYRGPGRDPATTQPSAFDPSDYANVYASGDREPMIRGPITPLNVLEPLLSLQHEISGIARTRPLRLVPSKQDRGHRRDKTGGGDDLEDIADILRRHGIV